MIGQLIRWSGAEYYVKQLQTHYDVLTKWT